MSHSETYITLKPINDLLQMNFFVPSFQRGYRWTGTEVKALLDDIYEFILDNEKSDKDVFYCLQPLIVYNYNDQYYVIDGQQRLTTIYIILTYLKEVAMLLGKGKYKLKYETRPESEDYLKNIDGTKSLENVDYYHIYNAYQAVEQWFEGKDGVLKVKMLTTLTASDEQGKNVKFIWYNIDPNDAINVFTRINIGKIPLTNAELIKALFLREKNYENNELSKKIAIASEWDDIERRMSEPKFWYFISNKDQHKSYDNKIEYLLDIISKKTSEDDKLHTFFYFNNKIEEAKANNLFDIDALWLKVKDMFQLLDEWYNDHVMYHYIGFLLYNNVSISEIIEWSKEKKKNEFISFIKGKIKRLFKNVILDELSFDKSSDKRHIRRILLLFNLETLLQSKKSYIKFPFDKFKNENWDIEHINPQNPFNTVEYYEQWCYDLIEYLSGRTIDINLFSDEDFQNQVEEIKNELSDEDILLFDEILEILLDPNDTTAKIDNLSQKLFNKYRGEGSENGNHISNLTLLDAVTNRAYGNSLFPVKRNTIIKNDRDGIFVPICTKNVFLKYYSKKFSDVMYWKKSDAESYFKNIQDTLSYYITTN